MFMRLKIHIFNGINNLEYDPIIQQLYDEKILEYENFFEKDTQLLEKDLNVDKRKELIVNEIKRVRLSILGFYLVLSYYFYEYDGEKDKNLLINFIDKIEGLVNKIVNDDKNLNMKNIDFWNYLISHI